MRFSKIAIVCLCLASISSVLAVGIVVLWGHGTRPDVLVASLENEVGSRFGALQNAMRDWAERQSEAYDAWGASDSSAGGDDSVGDMLRPYLSESSSQAIGLLLELGPRYTATELSLYDQLWGLVQLALEEELDVDVEVDLESQEVMSTKGPRPMLHGDAFTRNITRAASLANAAYGSPLIFGYLAEGTLEDAANAVKAVAEQAAVAGSDNSLFRQAIKVHTELGGDDVRMAHWEHDTRVAADGSEATQPSHFLAVDHTCRAVVLSIRGTMSMHDLAVDLLAEASPFQDGVAHAGMLRIARMFTEDDQLVAELRRMLATHPGYGLLVVGHSLGAGIAALLTILWEQRGAFADLGRVPRAFAFASPAVVSETVARRALEKGLVTSIVLEDDIVPRLSLHSVTELMKRVEARVYARDLEGASETSFLRGSDKPLPTPPQPRPNLQPVLMPAGEVVKVFLCARTLSKAPAAECMEVGLSVICARPPSHLDRLYSSRCKHLLARVPVGDVATGILLSGSMFVNHMPDRYEDALESTIQLP